MCIQSLRNIGPAIILYPVHKNIDVTSTLGTYNNKLGRGAPEEHLHKI